MMKKKIGQRGFTLIELLVVIAIIGILASVVLASLNSARDKGSDAAIRSSLNNMRAQAELWYDSNSQTYGSTAFALASCPTSASSGNIFADTTIITALGNVITNAGGSANTRCYAGGQAWVMSAQLKTGGTAGDAIVDAYCVDSTGAAKNYTYTAGQNIANSVNATRCN
ncbi:MAG TPA: type II secretion system protein [Candidatus Paceibacterota bacterium]|nr:type II secretion system protein [Candidatus Paceibacterota bacterium]